MKKITILLVLGLSILTLNGCASLDYMFNHSGAKTERSVSGETIYTEFDYSDGDFLEIGDITLLFNHDSVYVFSDYNADFMVGKIRGGHFITNLLSDRVSYLREDISYKDPEQVFVNDIFDENIENIFAPDGWIYGVKPITMFDSFYRVKINPFNLLMLSSVKAESIQDIIMTRFGELYGGEIPLAFKIEYKNSNVYVKQIIPGKYVVTYHEPF